MSVTLLQNGFSFITASTTITLSVNVPANCGYIVIFVAPVNNWVTTGASRSWSYNAGFTSVGTTPRLDNFTNGATNWDLSTIILQCSNSVKNTTQTIFHNIPDVATVNLAVYSISDNQVYKTLKTGSTESGVGDYTIVATGPDGQSTANYTPSGGDGIVTGQIYDYVGFSASCPFNGGVVGENCTVQTPKYGNTSVTDPNPLLSFLRRSYATHYQSGVTRAALVSNRLYSEVVAFDTSIGSPLTRDAGTFITFIPLQNNLVFSKSKGFFEEIGNRMFE